MTKPLTNLGGPAFTYKKDGIFYYHLEGSRWLPFYFGMAREFDSNFSEGLDSIFDTQPVLVKHSASRLCGLQTTY